MVWGLAESWKADSQFRVKNGISYIASVFEINALSKELYDILKSCDYSVLRRGIFSNATKIWYRSTLLASKIVQHSKDWILLSSVASYP